MSFRLTIIGWSQRSSSNFLIYALCARYDLSAKSLRPIGPFPSLATQREDDPSHAQRSDLRHAGNDHNEFCDLVANIVLQKVKDLMLA